MKEISYWLTRFILEARRADGNLYPANTLYNVSPTPKESKMKKVENDEEEREKNDEEGKETAFSSSCSVNIKHGKTRIPFHFYCEILDDFRDFVCMCVHMCKDSECDVQNTVSLFLSYIFIKKLFSKQLSLDTFDVFFFSCFLPLSLINIHGGLICNSLVCSM